ncbi:unnamed protein product [Clavelina lepadiformis]|uniref:Uncharacterized protein n=1 Tax=Clavelina lepadiformis TaxID=159417 RepID=A0ABP0FU59_CLALP
MIAGEKDVLLAWGGENFVNTSDCPEIFLRDTPYFLIGGLQLYPYRCSASPYKGYLRKLHGTLQIDQLSYLNCRPPIMSWPTLGESSK